MQVGEGSTDYSTYDQKKLAEPKKQGLNSLFEKSQGNEPPMIKDISGKSWKIELMGNPQAVAEAGATEQKKVKLTDETGGVIQQARIKHLKTLNEALTYHMIHHNKSNSLHAFMPQFITTLDKNGQPIDLEKELKECGNSIEKLCKKKEFQPAYIVIRDLVDEIEETPNKAVTTNKIKDFKMVKPSLQGTNMERDLHGYTAENFISKAVRTMFFKLSGCSFAFQKGTKAKWYTVVLNNIKGMITLGKTKEKINKEFEKLPLDQLKKMSTNLANLREAMKNSGYVFSDASLLFLPSRRIENGQQINELDIRLIDMSHALAKSEITDKIKNEERMLEQLALIGATHTEPYKQREKNLSKLEANLKEYEVMEQDMEDSLLAMEAMLQEIIAAKTRNL